MTIILSILLSAKLGTQGDMFYVDNRWKQEYVGITNGVLSDAVDDIGSLLNNKVFFHFLHDVRGELFYSLLTDNIYVGTYDVTGEFFFFSLKESSRQYLNEVLNINYIGGVYLLGRIKYAVTGIPLKAYEDYDLDKKMGLYFGLGTSFKLKNNYFKKFYYVSAEYMVKYYGHKNKRDTQEVRFYLSYRY